MKQVDKLGFGRVKPFHEPLPLALEAPNAPL
jgi:hypothetical protein